MISLNLTENNRNWHWIFRCTETMEMRTQTVRNGWTNHPFYIILYICPRKMFAYICVCVSVCKQSEDKKQFGRLVSLYLFVVNRPFLRFIYGG